MNINDVVCSVNALIETRVLNFCVAIRRHAQYDWAFNTQHVFCWNSLFDSKQERLYGPYVSQGINRHKWSKSGTVELILDFSAVICVCGIIWRSSKRTSTLQS